MKNSIWVEKYRPQKLSELVLNDDTRSLLEKFIKQEDMPHLLLVGNVGCGKTTIAKILVQELDCDVLALNASDERGIQVVRDKIKSFAMISSFKKWKIVFLDEADALTPDAQFSMRNIMEVYSGHTRFIMTANYGNKIIEPLRSRCSTIEFQNLDRKQIRLLLERILKTENVTYSVDDLLVLIDVHYPDIRSMVNYIQRCSFDGKLSITNVDSFRSMEQLLDLLKKRDIKKIRELGLDYNESYKFLFDKVDDLTTDPQLRVDLSLIIAEYMFRAVFVPDQPICFAACCLAIMEKIK